jgi:hypothetical protein
MSLGKKQYLIVLMLLLVAAMISVAGAASDDLLKNYEIGDNEFTKLEIGTAVSYWHQRMVDGAIVEGDYINYQFDTTTRELLKEVKHWREDVPASIDPVITQEEAESLVEGDVLDSQLYIIAPDSVVFPIEPTPKNPCWVIWSLDEGIFEITVIDAIEGFVLGYGVPPPQDAYALGGPDHHDPANGHTGCTEYYYDPWATNAGGWFNTMGYITTIDDRPTTGTVQSHIESITNAVFYELAHGDSSSFKNRNTNCTPAGAVDDEHVTSANVETWIANYTKMPFAFIGSCGGLCNIGDNSFSYEFRKGTDVDTATVGYCHMDWTGNATLGQTYDCRDCWSNSVGWQDAFFDYLNKGNTTREAFDQACLDIVLCGNGTGCVRFAGDEDLTLVPVLARGSLPIADAGLDQTVEQTSLAGTDVTLDGSGSSDPDGSALTYQWSWAGGSSTVVGPTVSLPLGETVITLVVDDGQGTAIDESYRTDTVVITVVDTTPPELTVPADVTVEQATYAGTEVSLMATATDICDADVIITSDAPAIFALGTTTVNFTATDDSGNTAEGTMTVTVVDTTPPEISVTVSPDTLWPPNHKMVNIQATVIATDICDADLDIVLESITSDEPDDDIGIGDGKTENDIDIQHADQGTEDYDFKLRAERAGELDGRVYTITYTAIDDSGNSASSAATVIVPLEK